MRKPGYLTSEFWLVVLTLTLTNLGALDVPDKYRWVVTLGGIVGYALSRAVAKLGEAAVLEPAPVYPQEAARAEAERADLKEDRARAGVDKP